MRFLSFVCLLALCLPAWAQTYSSSDLDKLMAPIALFPDPLLAELLPAAAYPADIASAEAYLTANPSGAGVESQPWEKPVIAVAHYPDVLAQMANNAQWTQAVGQAFQSQMTDVSASIQRLRAQAQQAGSLQTNAQQNIVTDGTTIQILPASPQYIYVPTYDSSTAYSAGGVVSFGLGMAVGSWLDNGWDWYGNTVYNRPWTGPYWTNRESAAYIHNTYNRAGVNNWGYNSAYVNRVGNANYNRVGNTNVNRVGNTNVNVNNVNVNANRNTINNVNSQSYRGWGNASTTPTFNRNTTVNAAAAQVNTPRVNTPTFNSQATTNRGAFDGMNQGSNASSFSNRGASSFNSGGGGGYRGGGGGGGFRGGGGRR